MSLTLQVFDTVLLQINQGCSKIHPTDRSKIGKHARYTKSPRRTLSKSAIENQVLRFNFSVGHSSKHQWWQHQKNRPEDTDTGSGELRLRAEKIEMAFNEKEMQKFLATLQRYAATFQFSITIEGWWVISRHAISGCIRNSLEPEFELPSANLIMSGLRDVSMTEKDLSLV